jgi:hypothetical protein
MNLWKAVSTRVKWLVFVLSTIFRMLCGRYCRNKITTTKLKRSPTASYIGNLTRKLTQKDGLRPKQEKKELSSARQKPANPRNRLTYPNWIHGDRYPSCLLLQQASSILTLPPRKGAPSALRAHNTSHFHCIARIITGTSTTFTTPLLMTPLTY